LSDVEYGDFVAQEEARHTAHMDLGSSEAGPVPQVEIASVNLQELGLLSEVP